MRRYWTIGLSGLLFGGDVAADRYAFLVAGDPQYLAEKEQSPTQLDPFSEDANTRAIQLLKNFTGLALPQSEGAGKVSEDILGLIVTGDLIDSADKNGGHYPAMQRYEWNRYQSDYGLTGKDGKIPYPVYEIHGNHDGPQGDTFIVEGIMARNVTRPGLCNRSENGLHYSWDWGPLHCVNLGMFVGKGEKRRKGHHYAPRASLEFLQEDLEKKVGDSGRPVILSFHLHPFGPEYDWPKEDLSAFWETISPYNVVALFHGHTHGSPPSRRMWNGEEFGTQLSTGIDIFNPDDIGASKTDRKDPTKGVGLSHGFLYVELVDGCGVENDRLIVRSYATRDNWKTHGWHTTWTRQIKIPDSSSEVDNSKH